MTMTWQEEYAMKQAKRAEFAEKHNIVPPEAFFGPRKEFQITSGAVRVTDPCYSADTWCAGTLDNVRNGNWLGWSMNQYDDWSWDWRIDGLIEKDFDPSTSMLSYTEIAEATLKIVREFEGKVDIQQLKQNKFIRENVLHNTYGHMALATMILCLQLGDEDKEKLIESFAEMLDTSSSYSGETKSPSQVFQSLKDQVCGYRQSTITVIHEDYKDDPRFSDENILETVFKQAIQSDIDVGVDSGQAGIFDLDVFLKYAATKDHGNDTAEHENFYNVCCSIACDETSYRRSKEEKQGIVISSGPVVVDGIKMGYNSSSGEGDGSYTLRYIKDEEGKVIMMNIMFMAPEEYQTEEDE